MMMTNLIIQIVTLSILATRCFTQENNFDTNKISSGEYSYSYDDGPSSKTETGGFNKDGDYVVNGRYSFESQGKQIIVTYVADEKGYHPEIKISDQVAQAPNLSGLAGALLGR